MRWTFYRKMQLLKDIKFGRVALADAMKEHNLTTEELNEWKREYERRAA